MGKVAEVKRGRSTSKGKDSDDSDEDYTIEEDEDYLDEEDEDKLFSNEEDGNDYDDEEEEEYFNDLSDNDDGFKEELEEKDFRKTAQIRRKRSGLARMKLGTGISNIQRNELRRYDESDDENETQTEMFQAAEEEGDVNEVTILKRKRSCLDQRKVRSKVSNNRRNEHEEFDDEDYNVEELEEEEDEEEEQTKKFGISEEEQED